jgi:hypothetical protein
VSCADACVAAVSAEIPQFRAGGSQTDGGPDRLALQIEMEIEVEMEKKGQEMVTIVMEW